MKKTIKEYTYMNIGLLLTAAGIYFFFMPHELAVGGVSGLAMVINRWIPIMPVGFLMLGMNVILFAIAFLVLGSNFGGKTIYASFGLSGVIWLFEKLMPMSKPLTEDIFIDLIFGILMSGVGMAIVFNQNASTGGTDIIAKILNKFFHISIGKAMLLSDFVITLMAALTFGAKVGMYALLGVIINGFVIDAMIEGMNRCKQVVIISTKTKEINDFIQQEMGRGATIYYAKGGFTEEDKEVLTTIVSSREFIRLRNFIKVLDKRAFITVSNVYEALGEGFKDIDFQ